VGPSSSASIVRLVVTASRAALRAVAARWLRHPRPGSHSPGFGAYEDDEVEQAFGMQFGPAAIAFTDG
jgi:hypothetical protein